MSTRCKLNPTKWREERTMRKELRRVAWSLAKQEQDATKAIPMLEAAEHLEYIRDNDDFMELFRSVFIVQESGNANEAG